MNVEIDVDFVGFYLHHSSNDHKRRTRSRLQKMESMCMVMVSVGQFGIKDVVSGLHIEMVWNYTDKEFHDYMKWVEEVKEKANE